MEVDLQNQIKSKALLLKSLDTADNGVSQMRLMSWVALISAIVITIIGLIICIFSKNITCLGVAALSSPFIGAAFTGKWLQKREEIKLEKYKYDNEDPRNPTP